MGAIDIEIDTNYKNIISFDSDYSFQPIPTIDCHSMSYGQFFNNFMVKNMPCVLSNISGNWKCVNDWVSNGNINHDYFIEHYDNSIVPVANCNAINFNAQCKVNMSLSDYMKYLKSERNELLYLKDWHLRRSYPTDCFYEVPQFFVSDWLNEYALDKKEDDFMFVYIGPKDSWTPLHSDVYSSYSWSTNIVGKKKWLFFPPGEENKMKDSLGNLPLFYDTKHNDQITYFEIIQEVGDAVFVPSGWHHQVTNLLDTISINHNWVNACNILLVWKSLQECLKSVELEIAEFKNTPEYSFECQLMLKSLFGMNYETFISFLCHIASKRLTQLEGQNHIIFSKYSLGLNHVKLDLKVILYLMTEITKDNTFFEKYLLSKYKTDFFRIKDKIPILLHQHGPQPK